MSVVVAPRLNFFWLFIDRIWHAAEFLVIDQFSDWLTIRIFAYFHFAEGHIHRIIKHESAGKSVTFSEYDFDGFYEAGGHIGRIWEADLDSATIRDARADGTHPRARRPMSRSETGSRKAIPCASSKR